MKLEPLPYYPFYWRDYRANRKVQGMDYVTRGLYRELLDECWIEGFIPDDPDKLATICGCPRQVLEDSWQVLSNCFKHVKSGVLVNSRMERERTAKDKLRVRRKLIGTKGGRASKEQSVKEISQSNSLAKGKQIPYSRAEQSKAYTETEKETESSKPLRKQAIIRATAHVCRELDLTGYTKRVIREVIQNELQQNPSTTPQAVAEQLVLCRRTYESIPAKKFTWPPKAFFEQGVFKQPETWQEGTNANKATRKQERDVADLNAIIRCEGDEDLAGKANGDLFGHVSRDRSDP